MSDVRARLADALLAQFNMFPSLAKAKNLKLGALSDHVVDVLLGLPGIAIVELPEPLHFLHNWTHFGSMAIYDKRPGEVNFGVGDWISPQRARELAAALLAAANAADAVTQ